MLLSDLPALSTGLLLSGEETAHGAELWNAAVPRRKGWVQIQLTAWCVHVCRLRESRWDLELLPTSQVAVTSHFKRRP